MIIGVWLERAQEQLEAVGIDSARLDAQILAETELNRDRAWLSAHHDLKLQSKQSRRLTAQLEKRLKRRPLAYITGQREFWGLSIKVTPDVLIPRPETENLVEAAIARAKRGAKVLEIGTGSGCVAVALKANRPDLLVTATDISGRALQVARQNARRHGADVKFVLSDMFRAVQGRYDMVLANLPYVPDGARRPAELDFEPSLALFGGADGLDYYRRFLLELKTYLTGAGLAIIEAGPSQHRTLELLAKKSGFALKPTTEYISLIQPKG